MQQINIKKTLSQLTVLFLFLTLLNLAFFIYIMFQNQSKLISQNAIQSSQLAAEDIRYNVYKSIDELLSATTEAGQIEVLKKALIPTYSLDKLHFYYPDGRQIGSTKIDLTNEEFKKINYAQTARLFNDSLFQAGEIKDDYAPLYIPIGKESVILVIKYEHMLVSISTEFERILTQSIIIGALLLLIHSGFLFFEYKILIRPMKQANTTLQLQYSHIKEDLLVAEKVQYSILPKVFPCSDYLDVAIYFKPMENIGGDIIDIIPVDETNVGVMVVDVMGHGVPSALVTTMLKVAFNTNANPERDISEMIVSVNNDFYNVIKDVEYYCTFFYGNINLERQELEYVMGNHPLQILYRAEEQKCEDLANPGLCMGLMADFPFQSTTTKLHKGDKIICFSDGIVETFDDKNDMYGETVIRELIEKNSTLSSAQLCEMIIDDVNKFRKDAPVTDDTSLVIISILK